jgi:hypothetical protein
MNLVQLNQKIDNFEELLDKGEMVLENILDTLEDIN